jgi:cytidylate kinase
LIRFPIKEWILDEGKPLDLMIAIDGPAGSGKTTIAQWIAARFGYLYFDTGVMYRAVTLAALRRRIEIADEDEVTLLAHQIEIDIQPPSIEDGRTNTILLDSEDVSWEIRSPLVEAYVSQVSTYPGVRRAMTSRQREIGLRGRVVMAGRDIGTVVLPEANLKIFLDASVEERARRRYLECENRGEEISFEELLHSMMERDRLDSTRDHAPLKVAEDAVVIDTTSMSIDEVAQQIMDLIRERFIPD